MKLDQSVTLKSSIKTFNKLLLQLKPGCNYSNSIYRGVDHPFTYVCDVHGEIRSTPYKHFYMSDYACSQCAIEARTIAKRTSITEVLKRFVKAHGDKYDYSKVQYRSNSTKVEIICKHHGSFHQVPSDHYRGIGCIKCAAIDTSARVAISNDEFIRRASLVHNGRYDYTLTNYNRSLDMVNISCPYHGVFSQRASDHMNGNGCQQCGDNRKRAKYLSKPTILYYLYFPSVEAYKIGITLASRGIAKRYSSEKGLEYTILKEKVYSTGLMAYNREQAIIKKYAAYKYTGESFLVNEGGMTECFNTDVLGLKGKDIVKSA